MAIYADKKDGKLTGRFRVEVQLEGRRKRGRFDTLEEAQTAEREWKRSLQTGEVVATEHHDGTGRPKTLGQLLEKGAKLIWNGSDHGENAQTQIRSIVDHFGDKSLGAINTAFVDDVILWLRSRDLEPSTINRYLSALRRLLSWGASRGREYVKVLPEFEWQDEDEGRIRVLTPEEETTILSLLYDWGQPVVAAYVAVALDTGCRRGELLNARPEQLHGTWLRLWADQTKARKARSVPLTTRSLRLITEHLPWSITDKQLRYWWDKAREAMGLSGDREFVVHALRHTCATRLVERGVNLAVVQKYMGHRSITTTLRYAHVSDDLLMDAALRLSGVRQVGDGNREIYAPQNPPSVGDRTAGEPSPSRGDFVRRGVRAA